MTPTELLTPAVLALAAFGYIRCLSKWLWLTLAGSAALTALVSLNFPFQAENALTWITVGLLGVVAVVLSRMWREESDSPAKAAPKPPRRPTKQQKEIVIDGTNVIYWDGNEPALATLRMVVDHLKGRGYLPYVFLDASSRHHLGDKSLSGARFAKAFDLHPSRVMVCPAGTEADTFILKFAKTETLPIVSNDRFGDRAKQAKGIKLVKGIIAKNKPILEGL